MEKSCYNPRKEAMEKGLSVRLIDFNKINSLLIKGVIYLRKSMNSIEKRCCLTYEIVHYSRNHNEDKPFCIHSETEEIIIRMEAANKLISRAHLVSLIGKCYSFDFIAEELNVTKDVLNDYFKYCWKYSDEKIAVKCK